MPYNLTSDDLEVEIGELIDQYRADSNNPSFGLLTFARSANPVEFPRNINVVIHVDARFTGKHVKAFTSPGGLEMHVIRTEGSDLFAALLNVRNRFVESAPSFEIAKGA